MTSVPLDAPAPFKGTEVLTLANGLRLILKEDHTVPTVSVQIWARCGAVDETPNIYGISHGLEHMVFKGTPTRSAGEISGAIESQGGYINAATQLETTHYYIDVPSYGAKQAVEVLADTILHPTFPQEELERERLVILEEIHSRDDNPDATLWDEFISSVFENTAYGIKVIGSEKTVSSMSQDDLFQYFRRYYVPQNKCVVLVGDFEKEAMVKKLKSLFEAERTGEAPPQPTVHLDSYEAKRTVMKRPVHLSHIALGIPTIGLMNADVVTLDILSDVLGGGASSRFYQTLREEKQVVLGISADYTPFQQKGLFSFFAEALPQKADEAVAMILQEIEKLKSQPLKPAELSRAKARIKSEWLHGSETPRGQASTLGSLGVMNRLDLVSTYLAQIDQLTIEDLNRAIEKYLLNKDFFITQVVPAT